MTTRRAVLSGLVALPVVLTIGAAPRRPTHPPKRTPTPTFAATATRAPTLTPTVTPTSGPLVVGTYGYGRYGGGTYGVPA